MEMRLEKNNCDLFRKTSSKHENCMEMRLERNKGKGGYSEIKK